MQFGIMTGCSFLIHRVIPNMDYMLQYIITFVLVIMIPTILCLVLNRFRSKYTLINYIL